MSGFCSSNNNESVRLAPDMSVTLTFGCLPSVPPPAVYGLADRLITIRTTVAGALNYHFEVVFTPLAGNPSTQAAVTTTITPQNTMVLDPSTITHTGLVRNATVNNVTGGGRSFFSIDIGLNATTVINYLVTITFTTANPEIPQGGVVVSPTVNQVIIRPPVDTTTHFIQAAATLTSNKEICRLDYIVHRQICNCTETLTYIQHCVDIAKVLRRCAVDFESLLTYSVLRLILSQIFFGRFSVKWLRQKYYKEFLHLLRTSEWNVYYPYFTNPVHGVNDFWRLFIC